MPCSETKTTRSPLPRTDELSSVLAEMMGARAVTVFDRRAPFHANCEVVRFRIEDRNTHRVLCKYGAGPLDPSHGLRGGVSYEAEVYRRIHVPLKADVPHFYGVSEDGSTGLTWLFLKYVAGHRVHSEEEVLKAADWIGRFHQRSAEFVAVTRGRRYRPRTYVGFCRRASEFADPLKARHPWFLPVCESFAGIADELDSEPRTVIHGEYSPHNILCRRGHVVPVDWETAAAGPGELDLGSLVDGWPVKVARRAARAYRDARWPEGAPAGFKRRMELARLFVHLRWLGDRAEWTTDGSSDWRFPAMRAIAARLGLLPQRRAPTRARIAA
jgi:phosphotransferase family enzyme